MKRLDIKQAIKSTLMISIHLLVVLITSFSTIYYSLADMGVIVDECVHCTYSPYVFLSSAIACIIINIYFAVRMNKRFKYLNKMG